MLLQPGYFSSFFKKMLKRLTTGEVKRKRIRELQLIMIGCWIFDFG
jgi:hypothetical protein